MANWLSEEKVLKDLGINNFRQLGKGNAIHFASMLDKMDPEVAQKALQQFPEFSRTSKEMLCEYKDIMDKGNLTFEEKKYILEQMKEIADKLDKKDTENKKWLAGMAMLGGAVFMGLVAVLAGLLGGKTSVKTGEASDPDPDLDFEDF